MINYKIVAIIFLKTSSVIKTGDFLFGVTIFPADFWEKMRKLPVGGFCNQLELSQIAGLVVTSSS